MINKNRARAPGTAAVLRVGTALKVHEPNLFEIKGWGIPERRFGCKRKNRGQTSYRCDLRTKRNRRKECPT